MGKVAAGCLVKNFYHFEEDDREEASLLAGIFNSLFWFCDEMNRQSGSI